MNTDKIVIGKIGYGTKVHAVLVAYRENGYKPGTQMKVTSYFCADGCNPRFTASRQSIDENTLATTENVTCEKCLKYLQ